MSRLRGRNEPNSQTLVRISNGREEKVTIVGESIRSAVEMSSDWDILADCGFLNPFFEPYGSGEWTEE